MQLSKWNSGRLLFALQRTIAISGESPEGTERCLVPLCAEVSRRQLPVRIDCVTGSDDRRHQCRKTLVIDDIAMAEWEDNFEVEAVEPGRAAWASQLNSAIPLPEAAVRALGIDDACADPAACLEGRPQEPS